MSAFYLACVRLCVVTVAASLPSAGAARAQEPDADLKSHVDAKLTQIRSWAADPIMVNAVKARNTGPPAALASMTQERWKTLSVLDPAVREFTRNDVSRLLKARKDDAVCEAFVSAADGSKVAFLSKPTNWSHAGKAKHDQPMKGEIWYGPIEVDESTGMQQLQVGVPVMDEGKPIGSLVIGLDVARLHASHPKE